MNTLRWTSSDLELLPDNGKRYEIVDGELYVSKQPDMQHQIVCSRLVTFLNMWSIGTGLGEAIGEPGLVFADDGDVVPDVVWISHERFAAALQPDGKFHSCPELVIETLSPGSINARRDREFKLKLYSRRGAKEYWIVNWQERIVEVYQREEAVLKLNRTLDENDTLTTSLLAGFNCKVSQLFTTIL